MSTYRTGRHDGNVIRRQLGPEPGDDDPMVAVLMPGETELAGAIVHALNRPTPDETFRQLAENRMANRAFRKPCTCGNEADHSVFASPTFEIPHPDSACPQHGRTT